MCLSYIFLNAVVDERLCSRKVWCQAIGEINIENHFPIVVPVCFPNNQYQRNQLPSSTILKSAPQTVFWRYLSISGYPNLPLLFRDDRKMEYPESLASLDRLDFGQMVENRGEGSDIC